MRNTVILVLVLALAVGIGLLRAHISPLHAAAPTAATIPSPTPAPPPGTIYMQPSPNGPRYVPANVTIHVGDRITWVDHDPTGHSATSSDGSFDTGVLGKGQSKSITFKHPGTFAYGDIIDSNMTGVVRVRP